MAPEPLKTIAANIEHFTGRTWLLPTLLEWFEKSDDRLFILRGDPGTGKSTITAWLAGGGPTPEDAEARQQLEQLRAWVKAVHFCVAASGSTDPKELARQMAGQLTRKFEGFGQALATTMGDQVHIASEQHVGRVEKGASVTGVYIANLNLGGLSEELSFNRILRDPLKRLYDDGYDEPMLLLVDALDEALTYSGGTNVVQLLAKLTDLPEKVRFLVTTRPDQRVLRCFREVKSLDLIDDAPSGADDIRLYVDERLALSAPAMDYEKRDMLATRISKAAKGIFLYAYMVLGDLLKRLPDVPDLAAYPLPKGLSGLYHDFLDRELRRDENRWYEMFKPVLGLTAVAQGDGLTKTQLQQITGKELEQTIRICKQYLAGDLPEGPFRVFHKSFAEFLVSKDNLDPVSAAEAHGRIADAYLPAGFDAPWETWDAYGRRYVPLHLSEAALLSGDPEKKKHVRTERLVSLVLNQEFQDSVSDSWALFNALELAAKTAAHDGSRAALPMLINSARELIAVRRSRLNPEDVFVAAERGDLAEAERRLGFFGLERTWRQAAHLMIAWLAAVICPNAANDLAKRVDAELKTRPDAVLKALLIRVYAALGVLPLPVVEPPHRVPSQSDIRAAINLMAGLKDSQGQMVRHLGQEDLEEAGGYAPTCNLITEDAAGMAAYARQGNDAQAAYVDDYLAVLRRNIYVNYRNGYLFAFLSGLLQQADQAWMLPRARRIAVAALGGNTLEFEEGLGLAIQAIRAKIDAPGAKQDLALTIDRIRSEAEKANQSLDDPWSMHLRRMTALGECLGYTEQDKESASKCLREAFSLWRGFAGFRAPACMTLEEAIQVTGLPPGYTGIALKQAQRAAHNIQEATFCAYTTARVNAMMRKWRNIAPEALDPLVRRFCADPGAAEFAPIHVVGEGYGMRDLQFDRTPLPNPMRQARSLRDIAEDVYKQQPAELLRFNAGQGDWELTTPLRDDGTVEVCIPDPDFAPFLAARLAAGVLANRALRPHVRVELIRLLVPIAVSNPTALDVVLMRLLLAASYWLDEANLQEISSSADKSS